MFNWFIKKILGSKNQRTVKRLQPVLAEPNLRLLCHEDDFDGLLADLALHRLDVVLADRAVPAHSNLKVYSLSLINIFEPKRPY